MKMDIYPVLNKNVSKNFFPFIGSKMIKKKMNLIFL